MHWGFLTFFAAVGGFYLVALVLGALLSGDSGLVSATSTPDLGPVVLLAFLPNLLLGIVPMLGSWRWGAGLRVDFGILPGKRELVVGLACGGFALLAAYLVNLILLAARGQDEVRDPLAELSRLAGDEAAWLVAIALFTVIGAPLTEELLLRGGLWNALEHYRVPRYAILGLTALVFAFLHEEPARTPALIVQGLAIGAARMITGRTSASIVAHAANNLVPALALLQVAAG
ncbi:hypothetical protein EV191_106154 [Tamaricihabitans halophyticus]|uniref:CAAX prenyl protease 2/Lysostaphin resistance protein A-like domain-containing protein n=2 Tax=Tamaricihabitans halophyticus TaxID=1262583 RepID=A0A4R2QQI8_9PSEU|nr:hypothetical protein EV191_106154 [Tamaricihabitans halophyticus]